MASGPVKWHVRFSFFSMAGGVLSGLGLLVLLQQAGIVYPTVTVTVGFLVGGLLWGILLPSLGALLYVRRANREYAQRYGAPPATPTTQRPAA